MLQCNEKIIKHKVGLLNLAEELGNVSKACQILGLSRDTFYRYRDAVEEGGVEALLERPRRAPNLKNRVELETENAVVAYAVEYPAHGQVRVHKTILQEFYQVTFRKKIYETIEQLQIDLDQWIDYYNNERSHQGKVCEGRTPMQTLIDGKAIWKEKFVG